MVVKWEGPSHRQRQALATRQQVASAARGLFAEHGYAGTTLAEIADAADIPAPTIYSAFGSKAKILQAIAGGVTSTLDVERGWTADRYETWLADALVRQLLRSGA